MVTVEWHDGKVRFIDQTQLPQREMYITTDDYRVVGEAIRRLQIRGAPAIGVAAAFAACLATRDAVSLAAGLQNLLTAIKELSATRPTAVNLFTALRRIRRAGEDPALTTVQELRRSLLDEACAIQREDVEACRLVGERGAQLISPGSAILTHCNAGALATAGEGTALSIVATAFRQGKVTRVFADETRPLLQGARLTSWELVRQGIPVTLITDSTAGTVLRRGMVQAVIVGADRIAANGDVANKVGTYPLAVLAARHGIPFYVAAPTSTIDMDTPSGDDIPIEERDPREVTHIAGNRVAADGVDVFSPAFDVTPNDLVTAVVTELGVLRPPFEESLRDIWRRSTGAKGATR
jgi:methylthioribose-1-phosphate isomerase